MPLSGEANLEYMRARYYERSNPSKRGRYARRIRDEALLDLVGLIHLLLVIALVVFVVRLIRTM